jgi:hypothetical protein
MAEDAVAKSPDVSLGFDAALGFAPFDQTSPALAAGAGALIDVTMTGEPVTELRIHGVSGSNAPTMLEHPHALQMAGDGLTGFYRRWSPDGRGAPSVRWKLEAYSCSGLTAQPLSSASWLLLVQFMMYNVAYFMLPSAVAIDQHVVDRPVPHLGRGRGHWAAGLVLRLLALAATVQFVSAATSVLVSTVAWQAAGRPGILPSWMGWYGRWTAGWRVALALAAAATVVAALYSLSALTRTRYERRTTSRASLHAAWPLTQPGFWRGGRTLVPRQQALHAAAGFASVALIAALPVGHAAGARRVMVALDAVVLVAAVVSVILPLADRHWVTMAHGSTPVGTRADSWCRGVLAAAIGVLVATALVTGWTDQQHGPQAGALPGLTGFLVALLAVQVFLLILLAVTVAVLARWARAASGGGDDRPFFGGNLASLVAVLGFWLGWLLAAVVSFGVALLLGTPVPSGFRFGARLPNALAVPWPIYAFGAAPAGLLCGVIAAGVLLFLRYRRQCREFGEPVGGDPSPVAAAYATATAGPAGSNGDGATYHSNRGAIANAWSVGVIADHADVATALAVGGSLVFVLAAELAAAATAGPASQPALLAGWWHGLAALAAFLGFVVAAGLLALLRRAYSDPARRRAIGVLWDVGTFWPRAVHPLAPPCYAERIVPEIVDRIRLLTGHLTNRPEDAANLYALAGQMVPERAPDVTVPTVPTGPVLLSGYSQGSIIAVAALAQLPEEVLSQIALLTLACPARLYGRAFPAYFGRRQLAELAGMLDAAPGQPRAPGQPAGRWKNLRRRSDSIGSGVFAEPEPRPSQADLLDNIDQPCLDPVILVPDANLAPPPINGHSQWWPDPRTSEIGTYLVRLLAPNSLSRHGRVP